MYASTSRITSKRSYRSSHEFSEPRRAQSRSSADQRPLRLTFRPKELALGVLIPEGRQPEGICVKL